MLRNRVEETANSPGTNAVVTLLGAVPGRRSFLSAFGDGAECGYEIASGTTWEIGVGKVAAGPPATLTRTTVEENSAGTTARLNFSGTVRVFNTLSAQRTPVLSTTGRLPMDQMPYEVAWNTIQKVVSTGTVASYVFSLPVEFNRFRFEWQDTAPAGNSAMYARVNHGGGPLVGPNDYLSGYSVGGSQESFTGPPASNNTSIPLTDNTGGGTFGVMEFYNIANAQMMGTWESAALRAATGRIVRMSGAFVVPYSVRATQLIIGFSGQNVTAGRFRLLGALA